MDIKVVAGKIAGYVIPFFGKSKTVKQISQEIGEAADNELSILWNSVKGWFIKEYEEETPIDDSFEAEDIKALIKSELKRADDATKAAIEAALSKKEASTTKTNTVNITGDDNQVFQDINDSTIQNNSGSGSGDNVGRDKKTYNIEKIDNANFS
jgi:hypothetical protein